MKWINLLICGFAISSGAIEPANHEGKIVLHVMTEKTGAAKRSFIEKDRSTIVDTGLMRCLADRARRVGGFLPFPRVNRSMSYFRIF